jgi:signal peptidase I
MAKTKNSPKSREVIPKLPKGPAPPQPPASHAIRETIESIVIAFVLAFLFRTFEAEAFVIPTGSMAPTLMGAHKDVSCLKCGHQFSLNASEEHGELAAEISAQLRNPRISLDDRHNLEARLAATGCLAGMCPNCRYMNPMRPDLPIDRTELTDAGKVTTQPKYNGDRILVNKYVYTFSDPVRWDVVVFKFPGDAQMNYIKRLVGLPGETIRVFQGDLFVKDAAGAKSEAFEIARKPESHQLAMRQLVHDTDYDPTELFKAGWPLRWSGDGSAADGKSPDGGWRVETEEDDLTVRQRYQVDATGDETKWLRYRHVVPSYVDWRQVEAFTIASQDGSPARQSAGVNPRPHLITDFNAYNTRVANDTVAKYHDLRPNAQKLGLHWVGDLMVEADVQVEEAKGELVLDLVEAGKHFTATIDLATGKVTLGAEGLADFAPTAETSVKSVGAYQLAFSNFDDELRLWVDGTQVKFEMSTEYDAKAIYGSRESIVPKTSETDPGDLAPVGIGARGTKVAVNRLQVWRDIYYVADSARRVMQERAAGNIVTDFPHPFDPDNDPSLAAIPWDPSLWSWFGRRKAVEFPLSDDQFFVMGDNSPESSDARLWLVPSGRGLPGGAYLERDKLIGKALCVYWPHSWNHIPGTPIPFPLFPNVEDMRLVR